jgi:peptidoglycan-associated lipoprotein
MKDHSRMSVLWSALGVALLALSMTACPGPEWPNCEDDSTCVDYGRGANYCVDGVCVSCRGADDCGPFQLCRNGGCERDWSVCNGDNACRSGQICRDGRCIDGCDTNEACGPGRRCVDYQCEAIPGWCNLDRDCPAGQVCQDNTCVPGVACGNGEFEIVYFDFDESVIRADQESNLDHNIACLGMRTGDVQIQGHCDERGTDAYNLALGERRARAARQYLTRNGADEDRLSTISYGEARPVARCGNESCWRQNRRAEFVWR